MVELADFFVPRQNEVGAKRVITVCPGLCEMSVGVERERSGVPTDVAFLSNGPIILFNFSIFLPSSIGAIQPFVARGRRRRTTSSSFTAKRSESFTILGVQVEVPTPFRSLARSKPHTSPATCRFHHNTILFVSPAPTPFSTNCPR